MEEKIKLREIKKIVVKGLFGFLDHSIELKEEGITFIHGPNGCGKTTFLRLIASFYEKIYPYCMKLILIHWSCILITRNF